ncbi:hypothetical protein GGI06_005090, partial [Coemansia sp. S85]
MRAIEDSSSSKPKRPLARQISILTSPQQRRESQPLLAKRARAESVSDDVEMRAETPPEQRPPTAVSSPSPELLVAKQAQVDIAPNDAQAERRMRDTRLPLAERLRPLTLDAFVGQQELVGPGSVLRSLIESDRISSMIFWGGPGLGKTTLARIIARKTKAAFKEMSAVTQNTADVKKAIDEAGNLS